MRKNLFYRAASMSLSLVMLFSLAAVPVQAAEDSDNQTGEPTCLDLSDNTPDYTPENVESKEYIFNVETLETGTGEDGEEITEGTAFADGYLKTFGTVTRQVSNGAVTSVEIGKAGSGGFTFTVTGFAEVKVQFSSTDDNNTSALGIRDQATRELVKDTTGNPYDTVKGTAAQAKTLTYNLSDGTYQVIAPEVSEVEGESCGTRVYLVIVNETSSGEQPGRTDWSEVKPPEIIFAVQKGNKIDVTFSMEIGSNGADTVTIVMSGSGSGETAQTTDEVKTISFIPLSSGSYTFSISAARSVEGGEKLEKAGESYGPVEFKLPLAIPNITSATSMGGGKISVVWNPVQEASSYEVCCDDGGDSEIVRTTENTSYVFEDLTIGRQYSFTVAALRDDDQSAYSERVKATATETEQRVWSFATYGSSTDIKSNGYTGSVNDGNGSVTVYSESGKGKIVPDSTDGIAFYYTAIPEDQNFTLKANVHVVRWTYSNAQEGFGLLASDRVGTSGDSSAFWTNSYMAAATMTEYIGENGSKYSMKLGIGSIERTGVTAENLHLFEINDAETVNRYFSSVSNSLENFADQQNLPAGAYNLVGNASADVSGTIEPPLTDFVLELQRNNTGYFITYYNQNGEVIRRVKNYDPDALSKIDSKFVYAGFFSAKNARATFSNVELTTIAKSEDAPAEERPVNYITPTVSIASASVANSKTYTLSLLSNVKGTAKVILGNDMLERPLNGNERSDTFINLNAGLNSVGVIFYPASNEEQDFDAYTKLTSTEPVFDSKTVKYETKFATQRTLYVAPDGSSQNAGTEKSPLDIYTAVSVARPGQYIILLSGTYKMTKSLMIERGLNGTEENLIYMIADPTPAPNPYAKTRPVLDFQKEYAGIVHGGNYWYFQGFDVINSKNAEKGFQVSGSYNTLDLIETYHNGNTGVQISRLYSTDAREDWPAHNLILNCTSYGNANEDYEDADGFAARLTVGEGNVFDGCVSHHNADDGWDLHAKVETGSIGKVTIQNCVAYSNGYLEDGASAGSGNGFKMGSDSMPGQHTLINSFTFFNKAKGIDSNSCPDIRVYNSISYNNESYNVAFYTNSATDTNYAATGIISFKDDTIKSGLEVGEQHDPVGNQDTSQYLGNTNYYWDGTQSVNASGKTITGDMFVSLNFEEFSYSRNADGTVNLGNFLKCTGAVPAGVGAVNTGTPSKVIMIASSPFELTVDNVVWDDDTATVTVTLLDRNHLLDDVGTILVARFDDGQMKEIAEGTLRTDTGVPEISFSGTKENGWKMFFLSDHTFAPVCPALVLHKTA